jgi:hypothetical protein
MLAIMPDKKKSPDDRRIGGRFAASKWIPVLKTCMDTIAQMSEYA